MSVVIIGGNERMEQQYKEICKKYSCKAKESEDPDRPAGLDHSVYLYSGS